MKIGGLLNTATLLLSDMSTKVKIFGAFSQFLCIRLKHIHIHSIAGKIAPLTNLDAILSKLVASVLTVIFDPGANRTSDSFCHSSQRSLWKGPELLSKIGIVTFSWDGSSLKGKMCQTPFNWRQGFHCSRQGCWNCDIWASYLNVLWQSP